MEIHGTIKNAVKKSWDDEKWIVGNIYGDAKGRFPDGYRIKTSAILGEFSGNIIKTKNSTYKVEWRDPVPDST